MSEPPEEAWLRRHPREVLRKRGLRATRALGQNFLVSGRDLDRVVEAARVESDEVVLEIGTGLGRLTARLARQAGAVVSVEIDPGLYRVAADHLAAFDNVELLGCDFLATKHRINPAVTEAVPSERRLKVVSNLPYGISSPALVNLLEWEVPVAEMYLMLQQEVAQRVTANAGEDQYGPLSVFVAYWGEAESLFTLPPQAFWPVPQVSSALVRIQKTRERPGNYEAFAATVRRLFMNRRKTMARNLRMVWDRPTAKRVLDELALDPNVRVEQLSPPQLARIADIAGTPTPR